MIIYLHGFNSSPESFKAKLIQHRLSDLSRGEEFLCPKLSWRFLSAAAVIGRTLTELAGEPVCLVGSSLGGFYAVHFAEKYGLAAVLLNPAVTPYKSLANYLGRQKNLYTGEEYVLELEHMNELLALDVARISRPERYLLLAETGDEVLDYREAVEKFARAKKIIIEGGNHAFSDFSLYVDKVIAFADGHAATGIMRPGYSPQLP
ncbi:MAG: alpha/beta fold hydrolase [Burkholderiales bacterium]|nr:alpha/beta fold hydrolase [Burkholderiales bacterium]